MAEKSPRLAKYESVAQNIASQIVQGRYPQGYRLHGRSTLASLYKVSPETIRKAMAILAEHGVVEIKHGSGVKVVSQKLASEYLESKQKTEHADLIIDRLNRLLQEQRKRTDAIAEALQELAAVVRRD